MEKKLVTVPVEASIQYWFCSCGGTMNKLRTALMGDNSNLQFLYTYECSGCKIQIRDTELYPKIVYNPVSSPTGGKTT